jgi:hypothetical protein
MPPLSISNTWFNGYCVAFALVTATSLVVSGLLIAHAKPPDSHLPNDRVTDNIGVPQLIHGHEGERRPRFNANA